MTKGIVVRKKASPSLDVVVALERHGVATVHEAQGRCGLLANYLRPIYSDVAIAGPATTVLVPPGDNLMIHVAVEICSPGDVLVVAPEAPCTDGYFGELLATSLRAFKVRGLVIDAGCRDISSLRKLNFPVWSRAVSSRGTTKEKLGSVNVPVVCAGTLVNPGDVIVADDDGVVAVRYDDAASVARWCEQRANNENSKRERLASGELGVDIYGLRKKLAELGLKYTDERSL